VVPALLREVLLGTRVAPGFFHLFSFLVVATDRNRKNGGAIGLAPPRCSGVFAQSTDELIVYAFDLLLGPVSWGDQRRKRG